MTYRVSKSREKLEGKVRFPKVLNEPEGSVTIFRSPKVPL